MRRRVCYLSPMKPTVLLFDVDGTLITSGGAGRRAIEATIAARYGDDHGCTFSFGGMTDRGIVRSALTNIGVDTVTDGLIDEVLSGYLDILRDEIARVEQGRYRAHVGVRDVLDAVTGVDGVAVGLGTGNVEAGARIKLEPVELNHYFAFGGFGCDAEPRDQLIAAGARRGADALGQAVDRCRVVIIGDTLKDVWAAHAIGAECLAVSTGGESHDNLKASAAELVVESLQDNGVLDFLRG